MRISEAELSGEIEPESEVSKHDHIQCSLLYTVDLEGEQGWKTAVCSNFKITNDLI